MPLLCVYCLTLQTFQALLLLDLQLWQPCCHFLFGPPAFEAAPGARLPGWAVAPLPDLAAGLLPGLGKVGILVGPDVACPPGLHQLQELCQLGVICMAGLFNESTADWNSPDILLEKWRSGDQDQQAPGHCVFEASSDGPYNSLCHKH